MRKKNKDVSFQQLPANLSPHSLLQADLWETLDIKALLSLNCHLLPASKSLFYVTWVQLMSMFLKKLTQPSDWTE